MNPSRRGFLLMVGAGIVAPGAFVSTLKNETSTEPPARRMPTIDPPIEVRSREEVPLRVDEDGRLIVQPHFMRQTFVADRYVEVKGWRLDPRFVERKFDGMLVSIFGDTRTIYMTAGDRLTFMAPDRWVA